MMRSNCGVHLTHESTDSVLTTRVSSTGVLFEVAGSLGRRLKIASSLLSIVRVSTSSTTYFQMIPKTYRFSYLINMCQNLVSDSCMPGPSRNLVKLLNEKHDDIPPHVVKSIFEK